MNSFKYYLKKIVIDRLRGKVKQVDGIHDEHVLQYTKPGSDVECDLVIGLDFGTSASKVVIQAPYLQDGRSFAVDFGPFAYRSMPFLLPSVLWVDKTGSCRLSGIDGADEVRDIKIELFRNPDLSSSNYGPSRYGYDTEQVAVAYLAMLLRYARKWLLVSQGNLLSHASRLIWSLNLGVPSPHVENNEENLRFKRIGKAGWMLSVFYTEVTLENAKKILTLLDENPTHWDNNPDVFSSNFEIVPEIVAGAVGYARSDLRREGAHVMIDIGASTIDVCSFILRQSDQNRFSLLKADVKQLGTIKLHHTRVQAIERVGLRDEAKRLLDILDPLEPIPDCIDSQLLSNNKIRMEVQSAEDELRKCCREMIRKVIHLTRKCRAQYEDVWQKERKLPVLLIGGGSLSPFYRSIAEGLDEWAKDLYRNEGISLLPKIPVPVTLNLKPENPDYHRLAVAWGLSHQHWDIGEIIPADQIKDMDPPTKRKPEPYISKDQV